MSAAGKALLGEAGMTSAKEADEDHDDQEGEVHPGKVAAMKEFHAAHEAEDHAGMSRALDRHNDIASTQKAK